MKAFINGEFVDVADAKVHISDLALQRGYGIFEFFKVRARIPLFIEDYLDRFLRSAGQMHLNVKYSRDELKRIVLELMEKNEASDCGIKFILTGGYSDDAYQIADSNFIVSQYSLSLKDELSSGISVITHEHVREMPQVKSINYLTGINTLKKMEEVGAGDVLYHKDGIVSEFPRCNVFIVTKGKVLRTPEKNVLAGITRKNILRLAPSKYKVDIGEVTLDDVKDAAEVFLTSTIKRAVPIVKIDGHLIGSGKPGPVTEDLFWQLVRLEEAEIKAPSIRSAT